MIFHHLAGRYRTHNLFPFSRGWLIGCKKDPLKCPCISYHRAVKSGERNAENPCISRISWYCTALQTTVLGLLLRWRYNTRLGNFTIRIAVRLLSYYHHKYHVSQQLSWIEHTPPKRGVGGSSPFCDASSQCRKPLFSRVFGFFHNNFQMQQILTVRARLKKVVLSLHGKTKSDKAQKREMPC